MPNPNDEQSPSEMKWIEKEGKFVIAWKDGHASAYPLPYLRRACPCALCRTERNDPNPLKVIGESTAASWIASVIEPVGHYAIKIEWRDGHSTGIYTFEMLRKICPCCRPLPQE
ncbi:MAG: DUF971 domain-containing protein [Deltaproteobacteria bacterium]